MNAGGLHSTSLYYSFNDGKGLINYHLRVFLEILLIIITEQSWGNDLESLGHMLLHFLVAILPWQGLDSRTDDERDEIFKGVKTTLYRLHVFFGRLLIICSDPRVFNTPTCLPELRSCFMRWCERSKLWISKAVQYKRTLPV